MRRAKVIKDGLADIFRRPTRGRFAAVGKRLACSHCGGTSFVKRRVLVHGPMAHCLTCAACSLSMWFEVAPERLRA